jgi:DNA-binding transcriptional regulator LsrR (DeoR family)
VADVVRRYEQGATLRTIGGALGIHRNTVSRYLHIEGVRVRRQPLTDQQVVAAAIQYRAGASLAAIGEELQVDSTTVWRALLRVGVPMRDSQGRKR